MVRNGAWWTFCAGSLSCFITGSTYTYGSWSPAVKRALGCSQRELNGLALAKDLGNFISMDAGLLTTRFGPHASTAVGSLMVAGSCLAIWSSMRSKLPFPLMVLLFWVFGHGNGFADNAGISTSVRNFPRQKGSAVGLMKAFEGLTAGVLGAIFATICPSEESLTEYPLLLAINSLVLGAIAVPIMVLTNVPCDEHKAMVERKFSVLLVALACFTGFCAVVGYFKAYGPATVVAMVAGPLGMFLLVLPCGRHGGGQREVVASDFASSLVGPTSAPEVGGRPDLSATEMLRTFDFYILFTVFMILQGTGFMFSNNLGQIVKATAGEPGTDAGPLVAAFSVFNTCGRLIFGFGSEALRSRFDRPWFLVICGILSALAMVLASLSTATLGPAAAFMGLALGGTFALQAVVVEELFGPRDMPLKYSCCFMAASFGSLLFSELLAGSVYDGEAARQGRMICLGRNCFGAAFGTAAGCCLLAVLGAIAVAFRSRITYRNVEMSLCLG